MNNKFFDKPTVNIIVFALLSLVEALQVLVVVALIFSFIPIPVPEFVQKLFPLSLYDVRPERESFFYHVWIATGLGLQGMMVLIHRHRLAEENLWRKFMPYICFTAGIVAVQIFFIFKIFLWGNPWWARDLFYVFLGMGIMVRIFWSECRHFFSGFWSSGSWRTIPWWGFCLLDAGVISILIILVFTPDIKEALSLMFSYDKFYHLDSFIMSPAWAHHNGLTLNKDVISEYSLMVPIVFDRLMTLAGGFTYDHALRIMVGLTAVYYFLFYGLLRYWLGSLALAFFAVILAIKLQFFHWGVIPMVWIYPSATPIRFVPDILFLFFILKFTQELSMRWLFCAALVSGLGFVWTMDVGTYIYVVLFMAASACVYLKGKKAIAKALAVVLLPWAVAFSLLSFFYGALVWQNSFWQNSFEFASLFLQGWGALPITDGLKDKQFFAFCVGFMIPAAYLATLLFSLGMFVFRQSRPYLFMSLVSVYGLGLYHYFIHRSGVNSYYVVVVPLIFVLLFWAKALLGLCVIHWQKGIKVFLCAGMLTALSTSYLFAYYPNHWNFLGFDWASQEKFYAEGFDFSPDAFLIDHLTAPRERVALISSFETKILMQANRPPFFYYFPMIESEHMNGEKLRGTYLHTYARLKRTLRQLAQERPSHVFIQTRLIQGSQALAYENSNEGYKQLIAYIRQQYQYQAAGQYLTALKLK